MSVDLAVIGGTGVYDLVKLDDVHEVNIDTPFGPPSSPVRRGRWGNKELAFLPRHGTNHGVLPHQVNYRANVYAIAQCKPKLVVGINAVGSMDDRCPPGTVAMPDQIIDYTHGREMTYYGSEVEVPIHIDFTDPYAPEARERLIAAGGNDLGPHEDLVLAVSQGPRLETAAEVVAMSRAGAHLVGMTTMPEAPLARELGLHYATVCIIANWAAGYKHDVEEITFEDVQQVVRDATAQVIAILDRL